MRLEVDFTGSLEEGLDEAVARVIDEVMSRAQSYASENLIRMDGATYASGFKRTSAVNTGDLLSSVNQAKVECNGRVHWVLSIDNPYASFVEWGAPPHFPPIAPIKKWVLLKLRKKGSKGKSAKYTDSEAESIAFLICRKIAEQGVEPFPFLRNALERAIEDVSK